MIFEGNIEAVSSMTEGISKKTGNPFRSCTITMAEEGSYYPQRIWASAMNDSCTLVQQIVNSNMRSDGSIAGVWRATLRSTVREWTDAKGNPRKSEELRLINLEQIQNN